MGYKRTGKPRGRPTRLTEAITLALCEKIKNTLPVDRACDLVGLPTTCCYEWIAKGEDGIEPYTNFAVAVKKALAESHEFWVGVLRKSVGDRSTNPNAAFFVLERRDRDNWGRRDQFKVDQTLTKVSKIDAQELLKELGETA
jgi:hypothetical protein